MSLNQELKQSLITDQETLDISNRSLELMVKYRTVVSKEVKNAKNKRGLEIHNTTRLIYENQLNLIENLIDSYDREDKADIDDVQSLITSLDEGEEVVA